MDSFLMLFDDGYHKIDYESLSSELWDNNDDETRLPPEPLLGNVEYKLKLINPTDIRFERLVSQVHNSIFLLFKPVTLDYIFCKRNHEIR